MTCSTATFSHILQSLPAGHLDKECSWLLASTCPCFFNERAISIHSPLILETVSAASCTQRVTIVPHQKQQQAICKLPSWKYMQAKREGCSSWKTTIIPRTLLYARKFTGSTCRTLYSYTQILPHRLPLKECLL